MALRALRNRVEQWTWPNADVGRLCCVHPIALSAWGFRAASSRSNALLLQGAFDADGHEAGDLWDVSR